MTETNKKEEEEEEEEGEGEEKKTAYASGTVRRLRERGEGQQLFEKRERKGRKRKQEG